MRARMVSHTEWQKFFREFSRIHDGALVTVSVAAPGAGTHDEIVNQSLRGISEDQNEIVVNTGDGGGRPRFTRRVPNADTVLLQQTDDGADAAVDIASADGSRTVVRFGRTARPERRVTSRETDRPTFAPSNGGTHETR
jgi:Family of unknown function (DUF5335)